MTCLAFSIMATLATQSALATKAGGFVGAGVGLTPDYEGSDDYEAVHALFGRYTWESGRNYESCKEIVGCVDFAGGT